MNASLFVRSLFATGPAIGRLIIRCRELRTFLTSVSYPSLSVRFALRAFGLLVVVGVLAIPLQANDEFDYTIMARSGQDGLTGIKSAPSINKHGNVAFVGNLPGESLFYSMGNGAVNITPSLVGTTFSTFLQLADDGTIVARDGSGTGVKIQRWNANTPGIGFPISDPGAGPAFVCGGGRRGGEPCGSKFDCLNWDNITFSECIPANKGFLTVIFPAMNNLRQAVFQGVLPGFISPTNLLVTSGAWGTSSNRLDLRTDNIRPVIADNGYIVSRAGTAPSSPLRLYYVATNHPLEFVREVAGPATGFSEIGQTCGISDDGSVVGFYGNLVDSALAASIGTTTGPGIFIYYTANQRLARIAGLTNPNTFDLSPVTAFVAENRVAVNKDGSVAFLGSNLDSQRTIFLAYPKTGTNTEPVVEDVIAVGGSISNFVGTVSDLTLTDGLNDDGMVAFLATMSDGNKAIVKAEEKSCRNCARCIAGECQASAVSRDVTIGVGSAFGSGRSGRLRIDAGATSAALSTPAALLPPCASGFVKIRAGGTLRQIRSRTALADIVVEDAYRYHIRFYTQFSGPPLGPYSPSGTPFATVTVENPDRTNSNNRLKITRNGVDIGTFASNPATATLQLTTGFANAERTETVQEVTGTDTRTITREVSGSSVGGFRAAAKAVLSRSVSVYRTFPWGEELVESREGMEPGVKVTRYEYYTSGPNARHLRRVTYPDGRWEFYKEYDPVRGLSKSVSQFRNNPYIESTAWPDPDNRSSAVSYDGPIETRTEYLQGRPISRRWHVEHQIGETWDVVATDPNAETYLSPSNLVTRTFTHLTSDTRGAQAGRTARVINPGGTMSLYAYFNEMLSDPADPSGPKVEANRTVTWSGAPNAEFTAVIDGTTSEEVTDLAGNLLSRREWDIASGVLTSSETVIARDEFGRATRTDYLDRTYATRTYGCCGLASETDLEGITTTYNTDNTVTLDLDRNGSPETYYGSSVTRAGITTHTLTDPLGRAFKTILQGTNGALIVQDERHYNVAGELEWSKDAMGRQTTYAESTANGFAVRTTTFPDGSQSIESTYQDGSAYETRGNAVQGMRYSQEMVQDNGVWVRKSTQTRLESDGSLSPEYTATYTDFAGRSYKTEYPWPDGPGPVFTRSEYNSKGQLMKLVDADGITTLYRYNSRGELETTAVDLDHPDAIDFAGKDRITRSRTFVNRVSPRGMPVRSSTTEIWETNNIDQSTVLQTSESSLDGTTTWTTQYGLTTRTVSTIDRANQRRTVTTTNPDQTYAVTVFDQGRQTSITRYDSNSVRIRNTTFAYDAFGRLQSETDARNGATTYTYNDDGQLHTVTTPDPDPAQSGPGYDPQTTRYLYFRDPVNGIKTVTTLPDNGIVNQEFFPSGQLKKTWGARTYPAEYTYDRAGRVKTLKAWQQFNFTTGLGIAGDAVTTWNYNARGLLANKRYADNKGPSYAYTAVGKLKTRLWARGVLTTYGYDAATGELLTTVYSDPTPAVTKTYDRVGRLKTVTDASGLRTYGYERGQTVTEAYGPGMFDGTTLYRAYDPLNRQQALSVTNRTGSIYHVTYSYDPASRLRTVASGPDVATYTWHSDSDLVSTLVQTHSNQVRLTTTKLYDRLNRLESITSVPSADSPISFAYQYNDANQRARVTLANREFWTYGYDQLGQVTNGVKHFPNGAPVPGYSFGYQFDRIGNRQSAMRDGTTDSYTNNALNQITGINYSPWLHVLGAVSNNATITVNGHNSVRSNGYFYAQLAATNAWNTVSIQARAVGQATNGTDALAEEAGRLFQPNNAVSLQYDADGNLLSDGRWSMTWDAENRIIQKESLPSAPGAAQRKFDYSFDSWGRRVLVKVSDQSSGTWKVLSSHRYLANKFQIMADLDSVRDLPLQKFTWGLDVRGTSERAGGIGGLLVFEPMSVADSDAHFCRFDGNGNVYGLVAASSGTGSAYYEYDPFGLLIRLNGPVAELNPYRFSTKYSEPGTFDIRYEYRDYRPSLGSWLSRDPVGEKGGLNLNMAFRNDPANVFDALGLTVEESGVGTRYLYTCNCGWIDRLHVQAYGQKFQMIWSAINSALSAGQNGGHVILPSTVPGLGSSRRIQRNYSFWVSWGPNTAEEALRISYRAAYQEELDQETEWGFGRWSGFSYEDIASDMFGGLVGLEMAIGFADEAEATRRIFSRCGVVNDDEHILVFRANADTSLTRQGFRPAIDGRVTGAEQPKCRGDICPKKLIAPYPEWERVKRIASGENPGGWQPVVPTP